MITPAKMTPAGAPSTPLPACAGADAAVQQKDGMPLVDELLRAADVERARVDAIFPMRGEADVASEDPTGEAGDYSPSTPVRTPDVKLEYEWPELEWDGTVIDLDMQHDLLSSWHSGSEEETSSGSDSSSIDAYDWNDADDKEMCLGASASACAQWFINVKTNVIHESRDAEHFKCGRVKGPVYVAVPALTGLRCGKCFPNSI